MASKFASYRQHAYVIHWNRSCFLEKFNFVCEVQPPDEERNSFTANREVEPELGVII